MESSCCVFVMCESVTAGCVCAGTSDPYVKFKMAGKEVFRSKIIHKNLNPVWDERTTLVLDSLSEPLYVKVNTHTGRTQTHNCPDEGAL